MPKNLNVSNANLRRDFQSGGLFEKRMKDNNLRRFVSPRRMSSLTRKYVVLQQQELNDNQRHGTTRDGRCSSAQADPQRSMRTLPLEHN